MRKLYSRWEKETIHHKKSVANGEALCYNKGEKRPRGTRDTGKGSGMENLENRFACNLRRLRRGAGLSQRELGERLGYSEKSISKWECGEGIPPVVTLLALSRILHVGMEEFLREGRRYLLGIDGGGTKTEFLLAECGGRELRRVTLPGSNPIDLGARGACEVLREGLDRVLGQVPPSEVSVFAGIAGGTSGGMREMLSDFFAEYRFAAYRVGSDAECILSAGLGEEDGVAVILGTGISLFARSGGALTRVGGWGYLFDDGGSGYNLGRDAIAAHFRAYDGSGGATLISKQIERTPQELLGELYAGGKRTIASYAPLVFSAAEAGDAVACAILDRNAKFAAHLIKTAAKSVKPPVRVVLAGGLCRCGGYVSRIRKMLEHEEYIRVELLAEAPVSGALRLAAGLDAELRERENKQKNT